MLLMVGVAAGTAAGMGMGTRRLGDSGCRVLGEEPSSRLRGAYY